MPVEHMHVRFKRADVETNGILECNPLFKNAHRANVVWGRKRNVSCAISTL
jgi:hypothetical protein